MHCGARQADTYDVAEPTYVSFHSRSFDSGSRHSNVISNSYGASNDAGLLRTETFRRETAAMVKLKSGSQIAASRIDGSSKAACMMCNEDDGVCRGELSKEVVSSCSHKYKKHMLLPQRRRDWPTRPRESNLAADLRL